MKKQPLIAGITLVVALIAGGGVLASWKMKKLKASSQTSSEAPPSFVEVVTAETTSWQPTSRLVGTVVAVRNVRVSNEVVGVVQEVGFDSGQVVEPGQPILQLDDRTEQSDLLAAQASVRLAEAAMEVARAGIQVAQADLDFAQATQRRYQDASASRSVSDTEVDRARSAYARATADLQRQQASLVQAEAERDQARARVQQIETILAKKRLVAPFRARASMRTVHPGQYLPEGTSIVELTELTDQIYLDFAVPQEYAQRVEPGSVVLAQSRLLGSDQAQIKVESIDATVNPVTRNVRVRSSVPNPGYHLRPGMSIDVEVPVAPPQDVVVIPSTAVRRAAFGDHVFLLLPGGPEDPPQSMRAKQQMITVGPDLSGKVVVTKGLNANDRIAAAGSFKLSDGALVFAAASGGKGGHDGSGGGD